MSNGPSSSGSSRPPPRGILKRNYPGSPASGATPKPDRSLATDRCQLCPRPFFPHIELRRRVIHHPLTHHFCELPVRCSACNERGAGGGPIRDHIQRAHQGRAKSQTSLKLRLDDSETKRKKYQARLTEAVKERNEAKEQLTKATKENARLKAKTEEQEKYIDEQAEKLRQAKGAGIVKEEPGIVAVRPVIIKEEPVEDPRIAKYQAEIATLKQDRSHLNKIVSDQAIQIHKLEKLVPVIQIDD
ncbi:unnamed protein product, partial [Mesorhabditis spiculigera]